MSGAPAGRRWAAAHSTHPDGVGAAREVAEALAEALDGAAPDLLLVFFTAPFVAAAEPLAHLLRERLRPRCLAGASAFGVVTAEHEIEGGTALSALAACLPGVAVDANYQLQVEDALTVSRFARVVFVDAARAGARAFRLAAIAPRAEFAFTTHALSPRSVLALARELYGKSPSARMLAIRGYDFGLGESLSARAEKNLGAALKRLAAFIGEKPDSAAPPRRHPRPPRRKPL